MSRTTPRPMIDPFGGTHSTEAITRQFATQCSAVPEGVADFNTRRPVEHRAALMLGEGLSVGDVAVELKVHRATVYRWLERYPEMWHVIDETRRTMNARFRLRLDLLVSQSLSKMELEMQRGGHGARWASTAVLRYADRLQRMRDDPHETRAACNNRLTDDRAIGHYLDNPIIELPPLPPLPDGDETPAT